MRQRWVLLTSRYPILISVSTLLSGTVLAQVIGIITQPIISRIYTAEEIGLLATLLTIPLTVAAVGALRYDMAIMLPTDEAEAHRLLRTSLAIIAALSLGTVLVTVIAGKTIATAINAPSLAKWLPLTGIVIFTLGAIQALNFWFNRQVKYGVMSRNRIAMAGITAATRIANPSLGIRGLGGLIWSQIIGQGLAMLLLLGSARKAVFTRSECRTPVRELLRRYIKMPLLNAPNALVDAVRLNGVIVLLGMAYSTATVGQFQQAWMLMQAPVTLISGAISQVFYQKFATAQRGQMLRLVKISLTGATAAAILPFLLLFFISPWLFPWFLGDQWELAGLIGRTLVPWLLVNVATSPVSTVFIVVNRQQDLLGFALAYAAIPLILIHLLGPHLGIVAMMWIVSAAMAVLLLGMATLTLWVARRFDKGQELRAEEPAGGC